MPRAWDSSGVNHQIVSESINVEQLKHLHNWNNNFRHTRA